jgi:hypothetical protein
MFAMSATVYASTRVPTSYKTVQNSERCRIKIIYYLRNEGSVLIVKLRWHGLSSLSGKQEHAVPDQIVFRHNACLFNDLEAKTFTPFQQHIPFVAPE